MPQPSYPVSQNKYDPRWFIWTIVFLVVTGISLVSYITLSDDGTNDVVNVPPVRILSHKPTSNLTVNVNK